MPNYYNPYNLYPVSYANQMGYGAMPVQQPQMMPQQSMSSAPQQAIEPMKWVEGEIGAKAQQMPSGLPANTPIPLWDSTDTVIYLKSWGPMGIPNPMQKLHYTIEDQGNHLLSGAVNGNEQDQTAQHQQPDMSNYVTKDDLNQIREELKNALNTASFQNNQHNGNQNGSSGNNNGNRNGNVNR